MNSKNYLALAKIYDDFSGNNQKFYDSWMDYITKVISKCSRKPKKILDLCCGTGKLTVPLSKRYEVIGLDYSKDMLSELKKKNRKIKTINADMRKFNCSPVDLVISSYDSINYILTDKDLLNVFKNVFKALNPGGLFVFDINSYDKVLTNGMPHKSWHKIKNYYLLDEHELNKDIWTMKFKIFKKVGKGYSLFEETHRERAYTVDKIVYLLEKAGFDGVHATDRNFNNLTPNTQKRIFFTAHKN